MLNTHTLLIGLALIFAVGSLIKPTWPLLGVAVILICVDLLVK